MAADERRLCAIVARHLRSPPSAYLDQPVQVLTPQNVVAGVHMGPLPKKIILQRLASAARIDFTGMAFRTTPPNATQLLFPTGAVQCSGTRSVAAAFYSLQVCRLIFEAQGLQCRFENQHVDNIVASGGVPHALDLARMEYSDGVGMCWSPGTFPGALYFSPGNATALVFDTGLITAVGISDERKIPHINQHLMGLLANYHAPDNRSVANKAVVRRTKQQIAGNPTMLAMSAAKALNAAGVRTLDAARRVLAQNKADAAAAAAAQQVKSEPPPPPSVYATARV